MGACYIVGAGDFHGSFTPEDGDLVIAADGGYLELKKRGIRCDILLGDMDSLSELGESPESLGLVKSASTSFGTCERAKSSEHTPEILKFKVEKDETDTHLAYVEGARRGYKTFYIYGGTGGREDHTFANYSLLLYGKNRGNSITLVGKSREFFVIKNESISLIRERGKDLSVFAFGGAAHGVTVKGAKYEAENVTLTSDFPLGVSNSFLDGEVTVSVADGALLLMVEK